MKCVTWSRNIRKSQTSRKLPWNNNNLEEQQQTILNTHSKSTKTCSIISRMVRPYSWDWWLMWHHHDFKYSARIEKHEIPAFWQQFYHCESAFVARYIAGNECVCVCVWVWRISHRTKQSTYSALPTNCKQFSWNYTAAQF